MYVNHCAQLSYTIQHRTVMIIFPLNHQTIIIVQMVSTVGEGETTNELYQINSIIDWHKISLLLLHPLYLFNNMSKQ